MYNYLYQVTLACHAAQKQGARWRETDMGFSLISTLHEVKVRRVYGQISILAQRLRMILVFCRGRVEHCQGAPEASYL